MLKLRNVDIYGFEITENYYLYHVNYSLTSDHEDDSWTACLAYNRERKQWRVDTYEGSAAQQLDSGESDFLDACLKALKTELNTHVKMLKSTGAKPDHGTMYRYLAVTKEEKN